MYVLYFTLRKIADILSTESLVFNKLDFTQPVTCEALLIANNEKA